MNDIEIFFQYVVAGLAQGSIYAIVAIGFNIIYNTTGIINFAQGEFVVLGAMTSITLSAVLPLWLAVLGGIVVAALYGAVVEIVFIRFRKRFSPLRAGAVGFIISVFFISSELFGFLPEGAAVMASVLAALPVGLGLEWVFVRFQKEQNIPVSYTHLTLPTKRIV